MIGWLRGACSGGSSGEDADAAVARGMADVLAALENVIDDDAALGRVYAGLSVNGTAPDSGGGRAVTPVRTHGQAARLRRRAMLRPASLRPIRWPTAGLAAALAAGAVAVAVIMAPGSGHDGTEVTAVDAAYVLKHVDSALSASGPGEIADMTITSHPAGAGRTVGMNGPTGVSVAPVSTSEEWSYGGQWRFMAGRSDGLLAFDVGFSTSSGYTEVSFKQRTWARARELNLSAPSAVAGPLAPMPTPTPTSGAHGCDQGSANLTWLLHPEGGTSASWLPGTVATTLRNAVSCGTLTVAGQQTVDGIAAIELSSSPGSQLAETVWVNPATYLPVRIVVHPFPGKPTWESADIAWLPPTAQNLARLTVPIPAGFRRVSPGEFRPTLLLVTPKP
jgi:hypothetical protein